jgi:hypothetical protein
MAFTYKNYNVDPRNADTPDYERIQSVYYGGSDANITAPASPNYPATGSTRYYIELPYIIDVSDLAGSRPISLRDVTGAVNLTRVAGAPGVNEYFVAPSTSQRRGWIELNASQAGNDIGYDFYIIGGQLRDTDFNNIDITGTLNAAGAGASSVGGDLSVGGDFSLTGNVTSTINQTDTTASTSKDTGAMVLQGGLGVEKSIYTGIAYGPGVIYTTSSSFTAAQLYTALINIFSINGTQAIASGGATLSPSGDQVTFTSAIYISGSSNITIEYFNVTTGNRGSLSCTSGDTTTVTLDCSISALPITDEN